MFFIIDGLGLNGKSTFVKIITALVGEYCQTTTVDTFVQSNGPRVRNDLAKLRGARIVFGPEVGEGKKLDEGIVKMISGRDKVVCRYLWQEEFSYDAKCKLFFYGNYKPEISGTDLGIWRRPKVIEFSYTFTDEEKIDKYEDILIEEELSGILNWALEGCKKWQDGKGLKTPECIKKKIEDYKAESNELTDFFASRGYIIDPESKDPLYKSKIYKEYGLYCEENKMLPISQKSFGNKLHGLSVRGGRDHGGRYWIGIKELTPAELKALIQAKDEAEIKMNVEDMGECCD